MEKWGIKNDLKLLMASENLNHYTTQILEE